MPPACAGGYHTKPFGRPHGRKGRLAIPQKYTKKNEKQRARYPGALFAIRY